MFLNPHDTELLGDHQLRDTVTAEALMPYWVRFPNDMRSGEAGRRGSRDVFGVGYPVRQAEELWLDHISSLVMKSRDIHRDLAVQKADLSGRS